MGFVLSVRSVRSQARCRTSPPDKCPLAFVRSVRSRLEDGPSPPRRPGHLAACRSPARLPATARPRQPDSLSPAWCLSSPAWPHRAFAGSPVLSRIALARRRPGVSCAAREALCEGGTPGGLRDRVDAEKARPAPQPENSACPTPEISHFATFFRPFLRSARAR
ncbi:hypothetical protein Mrad2831_6525 (plasmid) [Methylobacterium radiotolerans JCM 2831]|uniref:Uncharacterized protein n=1 Tax=Methylobacterium radiotolerans (strain ATCC 27329 / DSM 1819 / JCM 2831 / NBRC 15690 / NCIMB 10815 / 0-1) TaxID=426355 RepID=B1MAB2_METRJ|nr:hypothetical protein Mrad2831_6525 [Methylobacterium radiotolerans JCM 2831]